MCQVLSEKIVTAKKDYPCNASEFLRDGLSSHGNRFTFSEWRSIVKAKQQKWRINKGDRYLVQNNKADGDMYTFRAIPEIHAICSKHDFYPEC